MEIKEELSSNQVILILMSSEEYNKMIIENVKKLSKDSLCYVTLNKTHASLQELLKKNKVKLDNIVFIDAISKTIKNTPEQDNNCYFVSSPSALTEISISIDKFLRHNFKYLIFDSLTNLMIYEKKAPVAKFVSSLVNKIKQSKTKAVLYALDIKEQQALLEEAGSFVDKVIKI